VKTPRASAQEESICNCLAVRQAARQITQIYDAHLAADGVTVTQYSILAKLARLGPMSIRELASLMVMDRTTLTRVLRPLERDHLIIVRDGPNGRTRRIELTAKGKAKQRSASASWREAQHEFETKFGPAPAAELRATMHRLAQLSIQD
jgi:DNA-binding MarR family transcriptional regulator